MDFVVLMQTSNHTCNLEGCDRRRIMASAQLSVTTFYASAVAASMSISSSTISLSSKYIMPEQIQQVLVKGRRKKEVR